MDSAEEDGTVDFFLDALFWGMILLVALYIFSLIIAPVLYGSVKVIAQHAGLPLFALALLFVGIRIVGGNLVVGGLIILSGVVMGVYSYIYYKEKLYED